MRRRNASGPSTTSWASLSALPKNWERVHRLCVSSRIHYRAPLPPHSTPGSSPFQQWTARFAPSTVGQCLLPPGGYDLTLATFVTEALDTGSNKSAIVACNKVLKKQPSNHLVKVCTWPVPFINYPYEHMFVGSEGTRPRTLPKGRRSASAM